MSDNPRPALASGYHLFVFFLISTVIAGATWLLAQRPPSTAHGHRFLLYLGLIAMELLLVLFVLAGVHAKGNGIMDIVGRGWNNWRDCIRDFLLAIGTYLVIMVSMRVLIILLGLWKPRTGFLMPTTLAESIGWGAVSVTAGVCEEIVYRGYLQRQLAAFTSSLTVAVCLQAIVFGAAHLYQGWKPAVAIIAIGLILGLLAAWRRSIVPGTITHALLDILGAFAPR